MLAVGIAAWYLVDSTPPPKPAQVPLRSAAPPGPPVSGDAPVSRTDAPIAPQTPQAAAVTETRPQPPVDLATALEKAQADAKASPAPLPPGVTSWQGMTQEQAAQAFESAIREHSRTTTANPFRLETDKR